MKKILLGFTLIALLVACNSGNSSSSEFSADGYPNEYNELNLPAYPNVARMSKSDVQPLGDEDMQISVNVKTLDAISKVANFFDEECKKQGFTKRPGNTKLKELQERGAPYNEDNFYYGYFQNVGKVLTVTALTRADTTDISIVFMGGS